jgi:hypothetical protein
MQWLNDLQAAGDHEHRIASDLPYFCKHLRIRTKAGGPLQPFELNATQLELHRLLEKQKAETGKVRAVILKARQLGISTYLAARFFQRTIFTPGLRCIILGHERRASSNLFQIVKRFYDNLPVDVRPSVGTSNAEELLFDRLDSGYIVSVANPESGGTGRSATAQLLHASEVAFWADLQTQMTSLMQTVPDTDGSEIVLETTANSFNPFHGFWSKAVSGENTFMPVFLPWSKADEYRTKPGAQFEMDGDERALAELHELDAAQIAWRRGKIAQLGNASLFAQEFPLHASEAFISSSFDSFIPADIVLRARKEKIEAYGPLIVGVDPAGMGADATAIAYRQGHCITKVEKRRSLDTMQTTGWIAQIIREKKPAKVNIDVGGLGVGIYDRLIEQGHSRSVVSAVNFGGKPVEPAPLDEKGREAGGPANRRAELWGNLKKALEGRFSLPDSDSLQADLVSCGYRYDSSGRLLLESKQDMRKRGMPSPDEGDAVALCFCDPAGFPRHLGFGRKIDYAGQGTAYV